MVAAAARSPRAALAITFERDNPLQLLRIAPPAAAGITRDQWQPPPLQRALPDLNGPTRHAGPGRRAIHAQLLRMTGGKARLPAMSPPRVRCPTCKRELDWTTPSRPFCSERCRLIDLGAWLAEQHRIPDD
jgi:endogenous inhibitor of DNA gyrase (YacG/DUF329 family)